MTSRRGSLTPRWRQWPSASTLLFWPTWRREMTTGLSVWRVRSRSIKRASPLTSTDNSDLAAPDTLYITHVCDDEEVVRGGEDGQTLVAVFSSKLAAEHFVRYCVENQKTFAGVRP
jgi:hypothetical protein